MIFRRHFDFPSIRVAFFITFCTVKIGINFASFFRRLFLDWSVMPGAIRTCFLCRQSKRGPQSLYMTIDCFEQERRIRNGYLKRHKIEIIVSLIGRQIHRHCYRSILQRQSLARVRSISHPQKYGRRVKHNSSQPQSNSMVMID